jgi:hypothetical protein
MADNETAKGSVLATVKVSSGIGLVIFLLTLGVWIFFYTMDMRLDPGSTTVVATALTVIAIFGQRIWSRRTRNRGTK